jgi:hypothetical protein
MAITPKPTMPIGVLITTVVGTSGVLTLEAYSL